ncbi:nuclear pore complex protein Nup160-like [Brachionus plicatilis]|uniref:Nuclear pore complex protein Nup160-like n=1 Tax=Brachionus plicatilis TaxID=10195 RepID=A0A3M7P1D6_BRAPC|nr:nuclear pore complex protein Nup160-like [Brachionus plicatilis]
MDEVEENFVDEEFDDEKISEQILSEMDLKELYVKKIFEPLRYSRHVMLKSLGILGVNVSDAMGFHLSNDEIKEKIIQSIEQAVQSHPNFGSVSEEEFLALNMKFWSKYYTMLKQYDFDSRLPLGCFIEPKNESIILLIRKNSVSVYSRADLSQFYQTASIDSIKSFLPNNIKKGDNKNKSITFFLRLKVLKHQNMLCKLKQLIILCTINILILQNSSINLVKTFFLVELDFGFTLRVVNASLRAKA